MEIFSKYFIGNTADLNWEYIDSIPEFQKLRECEQNPKWHSEGNAWAHTVACLKAAYILQGEDDELGYWTLEGKRTRIMCVLFHDIGKGVTTTFTKGNWHSYGHEIAGERIARRILWDEPVEAREEVCSVVRYHMAVLDLIKTKHKLNLMYEMMLNAPIGYLLFTKKCDILGSVFDDMDEWNKNVKDIENIKCALIPFGRDLNYNIRKEQRRLIFNKSLSIPSAKVTVLIGLSGAGKDTYVKEHYKDAVVLCRDDIRIELGYCNENEKVVLSSDKEAQVTAKFDKKFLEAIADGKDVVINNLNLKRRYRDGYKNLLAQNGFDVEWEYVYIEAPSLEDNIKRRMGQVEPEVYEAMIHNFDWPRADEYDKLTISKQKKI